VPDPAHGFAATHEGDRRDLDSIWQVTALPFLLGTKSMKEIAIIAPIASISEVARRVVEENSYDSVDIISGTHNLWKGVEAARRAIDDGAKVLISRGGTYDLIKSEFDIPVVEIKSDRQFQGREKRGRDRRHRRHRVSERHFRCGYGG
jgi:hypothetical protein